MTWTPELEATLRDWLRERDQSICPSCGRAINSDDVSWGNAQTEYGTPLCYVDVTCSQCQTEIVPQFGSWWPGIDSDREAMDVIQKDAPKKEEGS